uniref:Zinc finger protein weckle n=1 Tax=Ceratitis capitata TaxID=7213 RepID=W8C200_CERCA
MSVVLLNFEIGESDRFSADWRSWCRLCAKADAEQYIDVLSRQCVPTMPSFNDNSMNLVTNIEEFFQIHIRENGKLSSWICRECYEIVKSFHEYKNNAKKVQNLYNDLIKGRQTSTKKSVKEIVFVDKIEADSFENSGILTNGIYEHADEFRDPIREEMVIASSNNGFSSAESCSGNSNEEYDTQSTICYDPEEEDENQSQNRIQDEYIESVDETENISQLKYNCVICQRNFQRGSNYTTHMIKKHNCNRSDFDAQQKLFSCYRCNQKFKAMGKVAHHLKVVHKEENPFICEVCDDRLPTYESFKDHMNTHTDYAPFECDVCSKSFADKRYLKAHMFTHGDKFICPVCGEQLSCPATYRNHMVVHSDKIYDKCEYCGREFKRARALKAHLILHMGMQPYSCEFCDKSYGSKSSCTKHMKNKHPKKLAALEASGEKPITCVPKLAELKTLVRHAKHPVDLKRGPKPKLKVKVHSEEN